MEHLAEYIRLRHNSADLQNKLKSMGYYGLPWSIDNGNDPNQIIVVCGYPYTVSQRSIYSKEPSVHYPGSFWNGGLNNPRYNQTYYSNTKDFGDDEAAFLECASRLQGNDIFFDDKWESYRIVEAGEKDSAGIVQSLKKFYKELNKK